MNKELVCKWLKVPSWPCDDYTLLGLPLGSGTAEDIESRVLERMELLRRYQLKHADIVTEAMNQLAQAMVRLTDPVARADYDRSLGLTTAAADPAITADPADPAVTVATAAETQDGDNQATADDFPSLVPLPQPADPEATNPAESAEPAEPGAIPVGRLEPLPRARIPQPPPLPQIRPAASDDDSASAVNRRQLYRELTRCRRMLRAWQACQQQLAFPERPFNRHSDGPVLLTNFRIIRQTLPMLGHILGSPAQPGYEVVQLARQPLAVQTLRGLMPAQRQALARDWKAGFAALEGRYRQLRRMLRSGRLPQTRKFWLQLQLLRDQRVEVVLAVVGFVALCIAAGRTWLSPW